METRYITQRRDALRLLLTSDFSLRAIGRQVSLSPNTVSRLKKIVDAKQLTLPNILALSDTALNEVFNQRPKARPSKRQPDWPTIHKLMQSKHQTRAQLWHEYRLESPEDAYSESQFNKLYKRYLKRIDTTMRLPHYAGECIYVDYAGRTIDWTDSDTGEVKQAQIFVGVLGCSNYTFAFACDSQKTEQWIEAHNRMLRFFGGVPQAVVPDNLKAAVIRAGKKPILNRTYHEWARYYDCAIIPARVRKPQDKSKAELGVKLVTRWITVPLRRCQFFSLREINDAIAELLPALNERAFKRMPGSRMSRFKELDKPALKPLPSKFFEYAEWVAPQKVGRDYHIYVKTHAYSVPYQLVGEKVEARVTAKTVELIHNNQRVASHVRSFAEGEHTTCPAHRPASHRAYADQSRDRYLEWAKSIGSATAQVVEFQYQGKPNHSVIGNKACSELKALLKIYNPECLEAACQMGIDKQSLSVTTVTRELKRQTDDLNHQVALQHKLPIHANVRGAHYYGG